MLVVEFSLEGCQGAKIYRCGSVYTGFSVLLM